MLSTVVDTKTEVLRLMRAGMSDVEIAKELGITRSTARRWAGLVAAPYLADPAFSEPPAGPIVVGGKGVVTGRDPSVKQIAAMTAAIRQTWSHRDYWMRCHAPHGGADALDAEYAARQRRLKLA